MGLQQGRRLRRAGMERHWGQEDSLEVNEVSQFIESWQRGTLTGQSQCRLDQADFR